MNIGIDIGGSHIGIGLVTPDGKILKKVEKNITENERKEIKVFLIQTIVNVLKNWEQEYDSAIVKIGIGIPGIVKNNVVEYSVNLGLNNWNLKSELQPFFPDTNISIKNDAKCAGLAEKKLGALQNYEDCIFICLGTGIGGAAFYKNELIIPKRSSGFEFGHMILQRDGVSCRCGSQGCFEMYGSMRRFKSDIKQVMNIDKSIEGKELHDIVKSKIDSDYVKNVISGYVENLSIGISNIIDVLEPEAICIGGSFAYYEDILLEKLREELCGSKYIFYKEDMPKIIVASLGNDAGIIGSALYA